VGRPRTPSPAPSELAVERLVQQGLLQFLQGGEFALIEAGEVLGFVKKRVEHFYKLALI
jgi:hypothetical protein